MEGLTILFFFLLSVNFVSSVEYYDCNPVECGGVNITYPFYISNQQPSHCWFPSFRVSCKKNLPLLNFSGNTYIIKKVSYTNQTLDIVNSAFIYSAFKCSSITSLHNLTLNSHFNFTSKPKEIVLLQDCPSKALRDMSNYTATISCNNSYPNSSSSLVGVYDDYFKLTEMAAKCRRAVSVPYEDSSARKMEDQMRKGFTLKWVTNPTCLNSTTDLCLMVDEIFTGSGKAPSIRDIAITVFAIFMILLICCCCAEKCIEAEKSEIKDAEMRQQNANSNKNFEHFIRNQGSLALKRYTYEDIKKIANNFKEKVGEGDYSVVYKGNLPEGHLVAVKLLKQSKDDIHDFINYVVTISTTNHVNIVSLLGFFFEGSKRGLVYEFMPNGSLEKFRRAGANHTQTLSWEMLFQIALSIARGLEYLHRGCNTRILHFDIKPHNILLDENFCPKISDFGLAKLCPQTEESKISMSVARETIGYIAPEVYCRNFGDVSHKSDVYSYGMMVLEVIGTSSQYFTQWIYEQLNREEELQSDGIIEIEDKCLQRKLVLVSLWCIQTIPLSRPSMSRVVQMLEGSLELIQCPPIPTLASPPRPQADFPESSTSTNSSYSELQEQQAVHRTTGKSFGVSLSLPAYPVTRADYRIPLSL